jgi:hypothetical protein
MVLLAPVLKWQKLTHSGIKEYYIVEQELLTLPEHLSHPQFLVGFVLLDL